MSDTEYDELLEELELLESPVKALKKAIREGGVDGLHQNEFDRQFRNPGNVPVLPVAPVEARLFGVAMYNQWLVILQMMLQAGIVSTEGKCPNLRYVLNRKERENE